MLILFLLLTENKVFPKHLHKLRQLVAELGSHKSSGRAHGVNPFALALRIALQPIKNVSNSHNTKSNSVSGGSLTTEQKMAHRTSLITLSDCSEGCRNKMELGTHATGTHTSSFRISSESPGPYPGESFCQRPHQDGTVLASSLFPRGLSSVTLP